jgi:RNA polymerase sigma-70 factor (ECF subfamily)
MKVARTLKPEPGPIQVISNASLPNAAAPRSVAVGETEHDSAKDRFERILRELGPALARLASGYERVESAREELIQEIALALWQALPHFRGECSERTFVYRIAHNRALTHACRRQPEHQSLEELTPMAEPIDPGPRPDEHLAAAHQRDRLRRAILRLPLGYRQVLMLLLEDLSHGEIAEVLGITENNVGVRLNRARKALKEALEERA